MSTLINQMVIVIAASSPFGAENVHSVRITQLPKILPWFQTSNAAWLSPLPQAFPHICIVMILLNLMTFLSCLEPNTADDYVGLETTYRKFPPLSKQSIANGICQDASSCPSIIFSCQRSNRVCSELLCQKTW